MFELPDDGVADEAPFPDSSGPAISGFGSFVNGELVPGFEIRPSTLPEITRARNVQDIVKFAVLLSPALGGLDQLIKLYFAFLAVD